MTDFFKVVSRDVASNPVARALAKRRIESAIRDFLIECYFLGDGTEQRNNYHAAARVLTVAIRLCEQARRDPPGVLRGALSCCEQAAKRRFTWRSLDAVAIDTGLVEALAVINGSSASDVQRAWAFVMDLERASEVAA